MREVKSGQILCRGFVAGIIMLSGSLYSFTIINHNTAKTTNKHQNRFIGWINNAINSGDGYNFANAAELAPERPAYTYKHNKPEVTISLTNSYDQLIAAGNDESVISYIENDYQNYQSPAAETGSAINTISAYLPAEMLASVTEEKAQMLINKASSLPAATLEKFKKNPELLNTASSLEIIKNILQ